MSASWTKQWLLTSAEQDEFVGGSMTSTLPLGTHYQVDKLYRSYCDWMKSSARTPDSSPHFRKEVVSVLGGKAARPRGARTAHAFANAISLMAPGYAGWCSARSTFPKTTWRSEDANHHHEFHKSINCATPPRDRRRLVQSGPPTTGAGGPPCAEIALKNQPLLRWSSWSTLFSKKIKGRRERPPPSERGRQPPRQQFFQFCVDQPAQRTGNCKH